MSTRALQGCRPTYQATEDNRYLVAIAAKDESGDLYFIVTSSSQNSIDVDVDLSAHLTSGTGTMYEFSSAYLDEVVGTPELANGHLNFTIPGHASILLEFGGGPPPPTDTPAPPTDTPEPQPTDTPGGPTDTPEPGGVMHVGDITMGCASQAVFHWATATVTILDASDQPVGTATVYGSFSGASSSSESDDTAGDGTVSFDATKVKNGGTWTFTVDDVVKSGWTYDEGSNVETSDSITCP
jgi:hypothetical protein